MGGFLPRADPDSRPPLYHQLRDTAGPTGAGTDLATASRRPSDAALAPHLTPTAVFIGNVTRFALTAGTDGAACDNLPLKMDSPVCAVRCSGLCIKQALAAQLTDGCDVKKGRSVSWSPLTVPLWSA